MELLEYLDAAVTPYHAADCAAASLEKAGFTEQRLDKPFMMERGRGYYVRIYGTGLLAFKIGTAFEPGEGFRIAAAHTDAPCLRVKPKGELLTGAYKRLNVEVYGGAILNTWFDRPLSIAGKVVLRGESRYEPEQVLIDFKRPLLTVPNLAIHMNREVNKGVEYKPQRDLLPLLGMLGADGEKTSYFTELLAAEAKVAPKDILTYDLSVYCAEHACLQGAENEFITGPRLDNQLSCYALVEAFCEGIQEKGIRMVVLYDHEEVGSRSKQGADCALTSGVLERIYEAFGASHGKLQEAVAKSMLLSVDAAHALHPNRQEVYDPVNYAVINKGVALKINSSQRYAFDAETVAILQLLCEEEKLPYQIVANHSDFIGGSTMGPILSSWIPMRTIDIGVPLLAMHSARELAGKKDVECLKRLLEVFLLCKSNKNSD